jgi:hypothetical protein
MLRAFICITCGTQYPPSQQPPTNCDICEDERQFVNPRGQAWTSLEEIRKSHRAVISRYETGIYGIGATPELAIGERALLVCSSSGNVLWDCLALLDDAIIDFIRALGELSAIAISHPHFYTTMTEWSRVFGNVPIYLHSSNQNWVKRSDAQIRFWDTERISLNNEISLTRVGGHFEGSTVLHWSGTADRKGALLVGDSMYVVRDRRWVTFMRSYPNLIPLPGELVQKIANAVADLPFERLYGHFWESVITKDAKNAVLRSAERYLHALARGDLKTHLEHP